MKKATPQKPAIDEIKPIEDAFKELAGIPKQNREKIWEKLEEIESLLRQKFKELGMLMPKLSDPRFLFGNKQR